MHTKTHEIFSLYCAIRRVRLSFSVETELFA